MKFYVGDEIEVNYAGINHGTVTGFYGNGTPRIVSKNGKVFDFPSYVYSDNSRWAILKPSPEREKIQTYFNQRSFWDRLCYLFTGKMPWLG